MTGNILDRAVADGIVVQTKGASGLRNAEDPHTRIHSGNMFSIDTVDGVFSNDVANGASLEVVVTATGTNYPHARTSYSLGGAGRIFIYELAEGAVSGGTALSATNKKWDSTNVFVGTAIRNPTVNMTGAVLKQAAILLGTQQGQSRTGSSSGFEDEAILRPNRPMLIRLTNDSGATVKGGLVIDIYNSPAIPT